MADKKISDLTALTGANVADTDLLPIVDTSATETKKITFGEFKSALDTATGFVRITGDTMTGDLSFGDNNKAIFGAGSDLQIYHDAADSIILDNGTGNLKIQANDLVLKSADGVKEYLKGTDGGSVRIRHNNDTKLETTLTGIDVTGTVVADGLTVDGNITSTGGDLNLDTLDLNAISDTIAVTAVDVFVYDTSKDSDGGAWRKRTQGTSWYNETLGTAARGNRKEFPAVAVIVVNGGGLPQVSIYDGDDPALPLWRECAGGLPNYSGTVISSVTAMNGLIFVGVSAGYKGYFILDFCADVWSWNGQGQGGDGLGQWSCAIANPSLPSNSYSGVSSGTFYGTTFTTAYRYPDLVNNTINDVAMTVLPNAPIDAATGLPVPTIAVATAGGVSVIKDDGTVVDINTVDAKRVTFYDENKRLILRESGSACSYGLLPTVDQSNTSWREGFFNKTTSFPSTLNQTNQKLYSNRKLELGVPSDKGVSLIDVNGADQATSTGAYITSSYNTGWMNGDIKGAFLSDTDATSVVGAELVTNGDFATDTDWTLIAGASIAGGVLVFASGATTQASQAITLDPSKQYVVTIDVVRRGGGLSLRLTGGTTNNFGATIVATGTYTYTVTPNAGNNTLLLLGTNSSNDFDIDNISVKLADADRSVNNNGLVINGTITRTPVATGADLVAYSGFSASNYLEQPYNSDLDFGTGDFSIMGWFKVANTGSKKTILQRYTSNSSGAGIFILVDEFEYLEFQITDDGFATEDEVRLSVNTDSWIFGCMLRAGSTFYTYINGKIAGSTSVSNAAGSLDNSSANLFIGANANQTLNGSGTTLALWRISATAPSAAQIAKIYNDEKFLFQGGAQATLYGASDAVTALAYDDATDLLHVGTSAGRSVFQGLRRVDNTTDAVGAAISASNGLVAED